MAALDTLPPDQRAVLSLVLKQGKSYAEIAALLGLEEPAVRERAHAALSALAPSEGTPPPAQRRAALSDFLLSQQPPDEAATTRAYLEDSASGRAWARVVASALHPLGNGRLPEIPAGTSEPTRASEPAAAPPEPEPEAATAAAAASPERAAPEAAAPQPPATSVGRSRATSRRAGALLLVVIVALAVALPLALTGGGGKAKPKPAASRTTTTGAPQIVGQVTLTAPSGGKRTIGVALVVTQGNQAALELQAQGLAPTSSHFGYGVWLYNSQANAEALGSAPAVKSNGRLGALAGLPRDWTNYRALVITRETISRPAKPGPIVLSGRMPGH